MNIPSQYLKLMPLLLIVSAIVFITSDQIRSQKEQTAQQLAPEGIDDGHIHSHDEGVMDHSDPVAQKRMGIFHYNEGNKFLNKGNREEAITHYRMALHHNKNFEEVYVNLSTAYLSEKKFDESRKTLSTLEKINPLNPSLHYNLACYHALTEQDGPALKALQRAVELGFKNFKSVESDPDLKNLRSSPKFEQWWETLKNISKH